jgi:hypothetical protein
MLSSREKRQELSYMKLIEVAVVAAFRGAGIRLPEIRAAREYVKKQLKSEFPLWNIDSRARAKIFGWITSKSKVKRDAELFSRLI